MTMKEAIKFLGHYTDNECYTDECKNAHRMAIESISKQVPIKPRRYIAFDGAERNGCPSCFDNEILYAGQKYCCVCGQKIDWTKEALSDG